MNNQKQFRLSVVLLVVVTISIVLFFGGSAKAATSDVLDQEQTSYSGNVWVNSDYPRYQTFTPFYSGQLSKIDICIFDSMSSPGALKVSIYKEGDLSTPLGSAQLASFGSGWTSVDFSSILPYLTRETMYRMVVSTENGGSAGFGWFTSHNDAYLRGYAPAIGIDFTFKTYMIPDYALSPTESQVTINNTSLVADGTSQTTVTIQLKDAQGNNITTGGEAVTIASSLGTVSAVTDHNNGTYTATLTAPTTIGTGSISASVGGSAIPTTASVQFVSGPPSLAKSTVTVNDNSLLADGISQTTVTVKLKDAQGNDVTTGGATVSILSTLGTIGTVTNHNNGTYTATLTAPSTAGTSTISATVNGNAIAATTSVQFTPKPAQTVDATVASNTPTVGSDNMITLSVKNALGDIDTTFNGIKNVTIFGYNQAPNGSIGHLNGQPLTSSSQLVALGFTNGVATVSLKLNAATTQSIGFIVLGVSTATTNSLTITPVAGSAASMKVTTDLKAPTINGGIFSQQPVVTLYDAYENISVNDYTKVITVAKKDAGAWMLTGTLTAKANAGIVSFSDLGSVNAANVSGAQLSFDATGLGQITSSAVTLLPKPFTVSFDVNGGSPVIDLTISYGDKIIAPTAPTKTGYTFAGWYKDAPLTTEWDFATETVTEDTTLYGK
ncbi:invasin domain 3-containing protein, partial [Lysinibacillus sphaericus]|uniref:invasin domain 3-containing protein n=1 Tax=Lysinibacillus sphaericus TaxID=1421 RepID=UPI0015E21180